jgi:hypothetical protein
VGAERGSVTPLVAVVVLAVGGLIAGLGRLGGVAADAARARAAADAAALAGAVDGERGARLLAADNGGALQAFELDGAEAQVRVRVGRASATARAVAEGVGGASVGSVAGLTPELQEALREAGRLLEIAAVPVTSGWRSTQRQAALYANRATNPFPVARPGMSAHERGRAVDVPRTFAPRLAAVAARVGLCRPWPDTDPVHFELCRRAA